MKNISKLFVLSILVVFCGATLAGCDMLAKSRFTVTHPEGVGFTFARIDENGTGTVIDKGKDFRFIITVNPTHEGTLVVKASGKTLAAAANNVYTIENVKSNKKITVEGLTPIEQG